MIRLISQDIISQPISRIFTQRFFQQFSTCAGKKETEVKSKNSIGPDPSFTPSSLSNSTTKQSNPIIYDIENDNTYPHIKTQCNSTEYVKYSYSYLDKKQTH